MKHNGKIIEIKYDNHSLFIMDGNGTKIVKLDTVSSAIPPHKITELLQVICKKVNS